MLNPFPELLVYGFFAPTLIRIFVALVFFASAYALYTRREELSTMRFVFIGRGPALIWAALLVNVAVGAMLFAGYYTQIAALVGALLSIKGLVWGKRYGRFFVLCRIDYLFVLVMCLSLLLTGAGALAFDLPL
jgi:uncharacterized membrane protein YphA (DoxX/SURF4 family)